MTDARLLVSAGAAWLGAAVATWGLSQSASMSERHDVASRLLLACGLAAVVLLAVVALPVVRRRHRLAPSMIVAGLCLALGAWSAALGTAASTAAPLGSWVDAGATAVIRGVIASEPEARVIRSARVWQAASRTEVRLDAERISARGEVAEVAVPIVLRLAPATQVPPPGSSVEVTGRLRAIPPRLGAAAALTLTGTGGRRIVQLDGPGIVDRAAQAMRAGLRQALGGVAPTSGSLVAGLAVGDESAQPPELAAAMRDSGLSHLTAVSGGNVAIVLGLVFACAALLRLRLPVRVLVGVGSLAFFVVLVGPQPSVLRAAAMGAIGVVGVLAGGRRAGPSILGAGILLLVLVAPWLAVSWGFTLSAFATAGLILLAPWLGDRLESSRAARRWPPAIREAVALTAAAQLATVPILVAMGGAVGWVALPANLLAMPAVPPVTVLGLLSAASAPVAPGLAGLLARTAAWPAGWIATVAQTSAGLPLAHLPWPAGWAGLGLLAAGTGATVLLWRAWRRVHPRGLARSTRLVGAVALLIGLGLLVALPPDRRGWPPPGWFLIMCDVGQGDALLVRTGEHEALVVDAGPDPDAVDACLDDAAVATVPALVLTHFHADHVRGLSGVLRGRSVAGVLTTPIRDPVEEADAVDDLLAAAGIPVEAVTAGDVRAVGDAAWEVIWPRRRIESGSVPNNASLVLALTVAGRRVLLSGDIEPEAQAAVAADLQSSRFDVVKVPHHGSRYQSPLLTAWAPAPVALISVGADNGYGHPAPETVAAWVAVGALVSRTDRDGDVAVVSTGDGVGVVTRPDGLLP